MSLDTHSPGRDDVLIATATKSDPQGEPVSLTFVWEVNGVTVQETPADTALTDTFDLSTLDYGAATYAISVSVTPDNGFVEGDTVYDSATVQGLHDFSTVGAYDPARSVFYLRNSNDSGYADATFAYGPPAGHWLPIVGDWNGDGTDTIGLYNPVTSVFYLRNSNTTGYADLAFAYGAAGGGWKPLVGDWNGDGIDTIGLYDPTTSTFYLRNSNTTGYASLAFAYGPAGGGWRPITGDWNGDGKATVGLFDPSASEFYLRNSNTTGYANLYVQYGPSDASGYIPLIGDWDGNGSDTLGLYLGTSAWYFLTDSVDSSASIDLQFAYGQPATVRQTAANTAWIPLAGDWNGSASALHTASETVSRSPAAGIVAESALEPIVAEAVARWADAGLASSTVSLLASAKVVVRDLPGSTLALTDGKTIYVDRDAAGHGWFVDATPAVDEEFAAASGSRQLQAIDPAAVDRIDLLTVVEHELGHLAGFNDLDASVENLMSGLLDVGVRRGADAASVPPE